MTTPPPSTEIRALDELGRQFETATAARRAPAARRRRALSVAAVGLALLAGTPALASITGVSIPGVFNSHSSIEETLPEAAAVIEPRDPAATGRALRRLGYDVRWSLVEDDPGGRSPTRASRVAAPPSGTEILAVLAADGSSEVTEGTRTLLIEVAPAGSSILESHR